MATTDTQDLRERIGRFRVLIVGRANAGKTTILQKVCNTTDDPEIYDTKGKKIDAAVVKSTIKRGNHDITNEMVFKSNSDFVFHDSCGFEAGSAEEFEKMMKFISERVHATKLKDRIHAIWYCIPMDDPSRTFQRSEEKFFSECDTGQVPVIAIFTKFEALRPFAYGEIKKEIKGLSADERSQRIAQRVEELFSRTGVWDRLCDAKNRARPKCHIRLENMNKPNVNCDALLETTTLALDDDELRLCLMSTQQSNTELCIKCAVGTLVYRAVDRSHRLLGPSQMDYEIYQFDIAKWFPHLKLLNRNWLNDWRDDTDNNWTWWRNWGDRNDVPDFDHNLFNGTLTWRKSIIRVLEPLVAKGLLFTTGNAIIQTGVATIIVLEYSAFLPNEGNFHLQNVESAVDFYLKSPTAAVVEKGVKEISRQGYDREELGKKIVQLILDNRMSKDLTAKK
jgi:GTP-binding protein EngB required for normal cell division